MSKVKETEKGTENWNKRIYSYPLDITCSRVLLFSSIEMLEILHFFFFPFLINKYKKKNRDSGLELGRLYN